MFFYLKNGGGGAARGEGCRRAAVEAQTRYARVQRSTIIQILNFEHRIRT